MVERLKKGTVIITEGRIYALFREINPTTNEVCGKCELREMCESGIEINKLSNLCLTCDVPGDGFFLECSPISGKKIGEISFEQNHLEAFASLKEAKTEL